MILLVILNSVIGIITGIITYLWQNTIERNIIPVLLLHLTSFNHLKVIPFCHNEGTWSWHPAMGDHKWQKPGLCPRRRSAVSSNPHGMPLGRSRERSRSSACRRCNGFILKKSSRNLEISKYIDMYMDYRYENHVKWWSMFIPRLWALFGVTIPQNDPTFTSRWWDCYQLLQDGFAWTIWKPKGIAPTYSAWQAAGRHYLGWQPWSLGIWQCTSCVFAYIVYPANTEIINLCNQAYQARSLSYHILCPFKTCGTASPQEILSSSMEYYAKDWALQKKIEPCAGILGNTAKST